ncbi:hypothetical protein O181_046215 [Austropuccinia psidii MF-1]|uniref:Uncharacterized protein n=1 Tax=Austropuccinia psidii MF-1 TaxID=1389203 RepID=A0A9Q3HLY7_9BASI|nr:hypothetical protein [Austropuccinia psidii MF-1]
MKAFPSANGPQDHKNADGKDFAQLALGEPSQHNYPPISGASQASNENNFTCEPETEVALMQSTEEPFGE